MRICRATLTGAFSALLVFAALPAATQDYSAEIERYIFDPCIMHHAAKVARETDISVEEAFGILKMLGSSNFDELYGATLRWSER